MSVRLRVPCCHGGAWGGASFGGPLYRGKHVILHADKAPAERGEGPGSRRYPEVGTNPIGPFPQPFCPVLP